MQKKIIFLMIGLLFLGAELKSQNTISGNIFSEEGEPLYGATVIIQNSLKGTVADQDGYFVLRNISNGPVIIVYAHLGFQDKVDSLDIQGSIGSLKINLDKDIFIADELVVTATRVEANAPVSHTNISKEKIEEMNIGRDVPYILNQSPSVVATSDAGAGIGYSGLRIRGIDQTNINVTINGIALNDPESHSVYWVDLPDFSSSLSDIQIQRGVGTSTNGAGAFGSTINMQTEKRRKDPYAEVHLGLGSFNSKRATFKFGTGIINKFWTIDGRMSKIASDGYVDRAHSNLTSYYLSGGFNNGNTSVKLIAFGGLENTYQAWNGIDRETMERDRTFNSSGAIYDDNWNVISFYENQVDNYNQDHLQLLLNQKLGKHFRLNLAGHYTYGRGYYESFRQDAEYLDFYLRPVNGDSTTDLIDRLWLDNKYYGLTYNLNYQSKLTTIDFGGAANKYDGDHFGEIIWMRQAGSSNIRDEYYRNRGIKDDFNLYFKISQKLTKKMTLYADMQYRMIMYAVNGTDRWVGPVKFDDKLNFFNPKLGLNYDLNKLNQIYYSVAMANREPNRNDYFYAPNNEANPEQLIDHEIGHRYRFSSNWIQTNLYYMYYLDQLVLSGAINDVGEPLRSNVGNSYRFGMEVSAQIFLFKNLKWMPNMTVSNNRNIDYKQIDENGEFTIENTPLAYSPNFIGNNALQYQFLKYMYVTLYSYYVGEQFLNNSGQAYAKIKAYSFHDIRIEFRKSYKSIKNLGLYVNINNVLDAKYESNGYLRGSTQYLFPQAGINYVAGLILKF